MNPISASSFLYPWDLADIGVDEALRRFCDDGFDSFDLTTCYHPITTFTPGAPGRRLMQTDRGGVFFPARLGRYGRIKPEIWHETEVPRAWPLAAEAAAKLGLRLSAWVVGMYQPWIAETYPDCARVLPTGQRVMTGVCPCADDVQDFLVNVVQDLCEQFDIASVQLEGVTMPFFNTGWRGAAGTRMLITLSPWARRLMSLCFCEHCFAQANTCGVEVDALRARVIDALRREYDDGPDSEAELDAHARWMDSDHDYAAFIALRDAASVRLVLRIADAIEAAPGNAELAIWGPADFDGTRLDLDRVLERVSVLQLRQPLIAPAMAAEARAIATQRDGLRLKAVHWCGGAIGPPFGPEFEAALAASVTLPMHQINLMNWALLPPRIASRIVPLLRELETRHVSGKLNTNNVKVVQ